MGLFDRFRGDWSLQGIPRPWGDRPSLYQYVLAHTDPATGRLKQDATTLPDEKPDDGKTVRWAAGALDGVSSHHMTPGDPRLRSKEAVAELERFLVSATGDNLRHLYDRVVGEPLLPIIDDVLGQLREIPSLHAERVHALGEFLAREAADREAVKLGMALLGIVRGPSDRELLTALGVHDEFTLFALVALANRADDPELAVWDLAKRVDGWGRIHAVERLSKAQHPEVRAWLVREGFRNAVMDEYLAYTCAMAGELHAALRADHVDPALLRGAAGIFVALCNGGPAQDMSDYAHANDAVAAWLDHTERAPPELQWIVALDALEGRPEISAPLKERIASRRIGPAVNACIEAGLASEDRGEFALADGSARRRGQPTFSRHEAVVRSGTGDPGYSLYRMMEEADDSNVDRALDAAGSRLDLAGIATGPSRSPALGATFAPHHLLGSVLQQLGRFPGKGVVFLVAGLRSPVVRNRNMALRAAAKWRRDRWPQELTDAIEQGASVEPDEDVRRRFSRVAAGEPFDEPSAR